MSGRRYFLDWLRVIAFGLLIIFHTGMLYVPWTYNLKSPRLVPGLEWPMLALSPWRLALLFLISGVACRFLIAKLGAARFALDRLRRLLLPVLTGMFVIIPPQTWIMLVAKGLTHAGYLHFWIFTYLAADQTLVRPLGRTMPTWDHLWFLVYLLAYTLVFALLWTLIGAGKRAGQSRSSLPLWFFLFLPALWLAGSDMTVAVWWPRNDAFVGDWGEHLKWIGMFATGVAMAMRDDFWTLLGAHRRVLASICGLLLFVMIVDHAFRLRGALAPPWDWLTWSLASGLYGWTAILTIIGYAVRYLARPSPLLSYLNEAILPVYVLHQPILLLSAYVVFRWHLPIVEEGGLLIATTGLASLLLYQLAIKPFALPRFLLGLKPKAQRTARPAQAASVSQT